VASQDAQNSPAQPTFAVLASASAGLAQPGDLGGAGWTDACEAFARDDTFAILGARGRRARIIAVGADDHRVVVIINALTLVALATSDRDEQVQRGSNEMRDGTYERLAEFTPTIVILRRESPDTV